MLIAMDDRDISIISQVAAKCATDLTIALIAADQPADWRHWYGEIQQTIIASVDIECAQLRVKAQLPGTTVQQPAQYAGPQAAQDLFPPTAQPIYDTTPPGGYAPPAPPQYAQQAAPAPWAGPPAAPAPAPAPFPSAAPAGGNEAAEVDALWRDYYANPQNWDDKRGSKRSDKSPDFTHRFNKQAPEGKYPVGLWLNGRHTPTWVKQQFGI
jgi:hypothetical protein